jgi:hypothetical protein
MKALEDIIPIPVHNNTFPTVGVSDFINDAPTMINITPTDRHKSIINIDIFWQRVARRARLILAIDC